MLINLRYLITDLGKRGGQALRGVFLCRFDSVIERFVISS